MSETDRPDTAPARRHSELTPRSSTAPAPTPRPPAPRVHWSKKRGVLGVVAAFAAIGFVAVSAGPTGMALAAADDDAPASVSLYASSIVDAQSLVVAGEESTDAVDLDRDGYQVYVTPTPTPTPEPVAAAASAATVLYYSGGGSPAEWMAAAGIPESDWGYVDYIVGRESGWNPNATNRSSGACGLVQALPCSKVPGNGYDPVDNLRWANGYAVGRYGSWAGAYNFWINNHWW
ncbi:transglycosylase SLT domain-containing protein [Microbacterium sediminicola]|uniref:aggregation-promoting factor C-terminal-like domain-containing protein n=1 Tax=Microbacterium sediminicola TaxID=415210 RepID=UPI0031CF98C5